MLPTSHRGVGPMVGGTHPSMRERERESIVLDYAITTRVIHMLYFFWFMLNTFYMVGCMP